MALAIQLGLNLLEIPMNQKFAQGIGDPLISSVQPIRSYFNFSANAFRERLIWRLSMYISVNHEA